MIKPEGLENFPLYIETQLSLLETITDSERLFSTRTILTPDEVEMIYPEASAPAVLKKYLCEHPTEHFFLLGDADIYDKAKAIKGKMDNKQGIRGTLQHVSKNHQFNFEKWQNFVHSSDNIIESQPICSHFIKDPSRCNDCAAKSVCRTP